VAELTGNKAIEDAAIKGVVELERAAGRLAEDTRRGARGVFGSPHTNSIDFCDRLLSRLLAGSSGFGPAWRVDGGKIVSLTA